LSMPRTAGSHYDFVTDAWKEFMGDHFHFGYFETEDMELSRATEVMIEKMLELCDVSGDSRILDVGCGIGGPAFYIHEKFNCAIDGISTSERGVELANITSKEKGYHDVKFKVANGLRNGFPDNTFDIVWIMETSHLIPNRVALFRECSRVLKENGTIVLLRFSGVDEANLSGAVACGEKRQEIRSELESMGARAVGLPGELLRQSCYSRFS